MLGIPIASALDRAVTIFANVVRTAPYGRYTARAQFNIGMAREKQGANDAAIQAYQAVVDKFPNEPIAVDAQYQIGYIWFTASQLGTNDAAAANNAKTAFQDFLFHYPKSEKAAQARKNLDILEHKQTNNSFKVAKFYDKQKYYRAAVIYYNEVIRQQPGSEESNQAKKRIDQLRAKFGDAALQPAIPVSPNAKKKPEAHGDRTAGSGPARPGAPNNEAPLPASEGDNSLPPPASLAPDTTTAPGPPAPPPGTSTKLRSFERSRSIGSSARRVRLTGALKASLATILCLAVSGCLGYHVGPVKPYYLRDVHSIALPTFKNRTLVPRIEVLVTDTLIKQFQQDGTFQITSDDKADATLTGEISRINRTPARSVRGNVLATTEFNLALTLKYTLTARDGKSLAGPGEVTGTTSFFVTSDVTTDERQALPLATEDLATRLVTQLSEGW